MKTTIFAFLYIVLAATFVSAKLAGEISYPWWIVLAPLWGPLIFIAIMIVVILASFTDAARSGKNPFQ